MSTIIDLRSDTVTLPPPAMRRAMYEAELGDDVYREDPTINRLQERTAALLGTRCLLVGIRPEIAASLVSLGVSLHDIQTSANLQQGVRQALRMLGLEVRRAER